MVISRRPEEVPQIGAVVPDDFGGRVQCGVLFIDRHRVRNVISGLLRWILNEVTAAVTCTGSGPCFRSPEEAIVRLADCNAIGGAIGSSVPGLSGVVTAACSGLLTDLTQRLQNAIDSATATLSILTLQGQVAITDARHLDRGQWFGSLVGRDFPGQFTASR
jgi:hypothetical protein